MDEAFSSSSSYSANNPLFFPPLHACIYKVVVSIGLDLLAPLLRPFDL